MIIQRGSSVSWKCLLLKPPSSAAVVSKHNFISIFDFQIWLRHSTTCGKHWTSGFTFLPFDLILRLHIKAQHGKLVVMYNFQMYKCLTPKYTNIWWQNAATDQSESNIDCIQFRLIKAYSLYNAMHALYKGPRSCNFTTFKTVPWSFVFWSLFSERHFISWTNCMLWNNKTVHWTHSKIKYGTTLRSIPCNKCGM